jgi:hypothetical protein
METQVIAEIERLHDLLKTQEESMSVLLSNYEHLKARVVEIEQFLHRKTKTSRCC